MAVLETVLKSKLEESAVADLLATTTSVWAVLAPQGAPRPYVTYRVFNDEPTNVMNGETDPTISLAQISIFADSFLEINNIFIQIRDKFRRLKGTIDSVVVQNTFYEGREDNFNREDNDYQRDLTFRFFWEE